MTQKINLNHLLEQYGAENNIVGFANKYYTLWQYKLTKNEASGELTFDAYFVKNLGKENPFGEAYPFEASLKGVEMHINSNETDTGLQLTSQEYRALKFSAGTEAGIEIATYNDLSRLVWKYNTKYVRRGLSQTRIDAELANMANRAIELGAQIIDGTIYHPNDLDTTTFSLNPYCGVKIAECEDVNAICWKWNTKSVKDMLPEAIKDKELENIKQRAIELGAIQYMNRLYTPAQQSEEWLIEALEVNDKVKNGEPVEFTPAHGLNENGCLMSGDTAFKFETKYYPGTYYCPHEYWLPLNNKGKATRIKNKKIRINRYEKAENEYGGTYYKVIDWEIVK